MTCLLIDLPPFIPIVLAVDNELLMCYAKFCCIQYLLSRMCVVYTFTEDL